jgi:hypothetical protein
VLTVDQQDTNFSASEYCYSACVIQKARNSWCYNMLLLVIKKKMICFLLISSGGTIAGLSLGSWLGTLKAKVCLPSYEFSLCP